MKREIFFSLIFEKFTFREIKHFRWKDKEIYLKVNILKFFKLEFIYLIFTSELFTSAIETLKVKQNIL